MRGSVSRLFPRPALWVTVTVVGVFALFVAVRSCIYAVAPDPGAIVNDGRVTLKASGALDGAVRLRTGQPPHVNCVTAGPSFMDPDVAAARLLPGQTLLSISMPMLAGSRPLKIEIAGALNPNVNTYGIVPDADAEKHPERGLRVRLTARPDPPLGLGGVGRDSPDEWLAQSGTVTILGHKSDPANAAVHAGQIWGSMHLKLVPEGENPDRRSLTLDGGWLCDHTNVPVEFERPSPTPMVWFLPSASSRIS